METMESYVQHDTCKTCLFCGEVCPNLLLSKSEDDKVLFHPNFNELCINCGHCMAICPTNSIHIHNLQYEKDVYSLNNEKLGYPFFQLVEKRRAVRKFKDKEVDKALLQKITDGIALAPVSFPPNNLNLSIITSKSVLDKSLEIITNAYFQLDKMLKNPFLKMMIKRKAGEEYYTLKDYILPMLSSKAEKIKNKEIDPIFRNAPAVFVIHGGEDAQNKAEDGLIALTFGILAATDLGLQTCPVSLIPPIINTNNELKDLFKIPHENKAIASFIVGYGKFKYKKGIKRNLKSIQWIT